MLHQKRETGQLILYSFVFRERFSSKETTETKIIFHSKRHHKQGRKRAQRRERETTRQQKNLERGDLAFVRALFVRRC